MTELDPSQGAYVEPIDSVSVASDLLKRFRGAVAEPSDWYEVLEVLDDFVAVRNRPAVDVIFNEWLLHPEEAEEFPVMIRKALNDIPRMTDEAFAYLSGLSRLVQHQTQANSTGDPHGHRTWQDQIYDHVDVWYPHIFRYLNADAARTLSQTSYGFHDLVQTISAHKDQGETALENFEQYQSGVPGKKMLMRCEQARNTLVNRVILLQAYLLSNTSRGAVAASLLGEDPKNDRYSNLACTAAMDQLDILLKVANAFDVSRELKEHFYYGNPTRRRLVKLRTQLAVVQRCLDFVPFTADSTHAVTKAFGDLLKAKPVGIWWAFASLEASLLAAGRKLPTAS